MTHTDFSTWFDRLPLGAVFVLTVGFVLLAIMLGVRLGRLGRERSASEGAEAIGSVVGATLGLLAFILAFTFGMTASRYDMRKQLLLDEANAIGTTYLRVGLLGETHRPEMRALLREYVDKRVGAAQDPRTLPEAIQRSEAIHDLLWARVEQMNAQAPASVTQALFIESLNETIDLHTKRITVGRGYRVPATIWLGLYMVSALAMIAVGYQFAQSRHRHLLVSVMLALAFSSVLVLIADLDRASEGTVRLNQQPLLDLQRKIHAGP